jgi:AcrR family transcriptional regulator
MTSNEKDARQSIIEAAKDLMNETGDIGKITVRQIAEKAKVGIGLINYHFKSKDNLLSIAIGDVMTDTIYQFMKENAKSKSDPVSKLKMLVKELYSLAGNSDKVLRFILTREVMEGDLKTALHLVPLLKEIYGDEEDMRLRIIALQILHPIQVTGLNTEAFHMYSGIDLYNTKQRNNFIDMVIDNLIHNNKEKR